MNESIRNNILFYNEMNPERYKEILDICQLTPDTTAVKIITDNTKETKKLNDDELEEEKQKLLKILKYNEK